MYTKGVLTILNSQFINNYSTEGSAIFISTFDEPID